MSHGPTPCGDYCPANTRHDTNQGPASPPPVATCAATDIASPSAGPGQGVGAAPHGSTLRRAGGEQQHSVATVARGARLDKKCDGRRCEPINNREGARTRWGVGKMGATAGANSPGDSVLLVRPGGGRRPHSPTCSSGRTGAAAPRAVQRFGFVGATAKKHVPLRDGRRCPSRPPHPAAAAQPAGQSCHARCGAARRGPRSVQRLAGPAAQPGLAWTGLPGTGWPGLVSGVLISPP